MAFSGFFHLDVADVCLRLDHLDCHGGGGLPAHDAAGLRLEHAPEGAGAEEDAEVEPLSGELVLPERCNVQCFKLNTKDKQCSFVYLS